jgi:hypothetical protein
LAQSDDDPTDDEIWPTYEERQALRAAGTPFIPPSLRQVQEDVDDSDIPVLWLSGKRMYAIDLHPEKWTNPCDDLALSIGESHAKALSRRASSGDL